MSEAGSNLAESLMEIGTKYQVLELSEEEQKELEDYTERKMKYIESTGDERMKSIKK